MPSSTIEILRWLTTVFFRDLEARAAIACQTSVLVARAKMTQATSRSNKKHFSSWNALNHSDKCSNSFKLRSNMYLSLGPKDMAKRLINIRKRVLIYSCFIARDTWRHMSTRLNKGHAQFSSPPRM